MKLIHLKNELMISIEEDTTLVTEYVEGMYLSDIIDNVSDDADWDDFDRAYSRYLTIDTGGERLSIELSARDPNILEFQLKKPPKPRRRESLPRWLMPKKLTRG